ncbi:unnamed protein product [Schistosoma rodhaini]|uniref:non-specific serine/threonine protein kinase n=1 Tax=Schistosoma rodhaini TaxID=6188 RepID=A0AA85EVE6_9TREM|nr:unnamed protein product [Schistosoma rodhaini]
MNACGHCRIGLNGVIDRQSCTTECSVASGTSPDYCQDSGNFCVCGAPGCSTRKVTNRHNMESNITELTSTIDGASTTNFPDQHQDTSKPKLGTYVIERTIGKGIFSSVKLAKHTITGIFVAIKIIDKSRLSPENLKKIYRESDILKELHHSNIVKLYQVMETQRLLCMVMEYVSNGELFDFSFGTHFNSPNHLLTTWCGSPPYAAPEIFLGEPYIGVKADIWSLGVILYVMVCGALPFDAQSLPHLKNQVLSASFRVPYWLSMACEQVIRSMLSKEPSDRPTTKRISLFPWFTSSTIPHNRYHDKLIANVMSNSLATMHLTNKPVPTQTTLQQTLSPCGANTNILNKSTDYDLVQPTFILKHCSCDCSSKFSWSKDDLQSPGPNLAAEMKVGKLNELVIMIMESYGMCRTQILKSLLRCAYDHLTATYLLLGEKLRLHNLNIDSSTTPITDSGIIIPNCDHPTTSCYSIMAPEHKSFNTSPDSVVMPNSIPSPQPLSSSVSQTQPNYSAIPKSIPSVFPLSSINSMNMDLPLSSCSSSMEQLDESTNNLNYFADTSIDNSDHKDSISQIIDKTESDDLTVDSAYGVALQSTYVNNSASDRIILQSYKPVEDELRIVSGGTGNVTVGSRPQHRVLARRKYGICSPPACLEEIKQALISQQHQQTHERNITDDDD